MGEHSSTTSRSEQLHTLCSALSVLPFTLRPFSAALMRALCSDDSPAVGLPTAPGTLAATRRARSASSARMTSSLSGDSVRGAGGPASKLEVPGVSHALSSGLNRVEPLRPAASSCHSSRVPARAGRQCGTRGAAPRQGLAPGAGQGLPLRGRRTTARVGPIA